MSQSRTFRRLSGLLGTRASPVGPGPATPRPNLSSEEFSEKVRVLNHDPYLFIADEARKLISVFDDLKYDRADLDMLSDPMRRRALAKLTPLGFRQVSGSLLENKALDIRIHLPKFRALGASPFDACRDTRRRAQDYFILTPTQAACQIIDHYPLAEASRMIEALVVRHPVNLLRIIDFLEKGDDRQSVLNAIGHLRYVQRKAVEAEPLKTRYALR